MSISKAQEGKIVQIDEERIKRHLGEIVRGSVQETLNALLDAEEDRLCGATLRRQEGHTGEPLRTQAAHDKWRSEPEGAEAPEAAL